MACARCLTTSDAKSLGVLVGASAAGCPLSEVLQERRWAMQLEVGEEHTRQQAKHLPDVRAHAAARTTSLLNTLIRSGCDNIPRTCVVCLCSHSKRNVSKPNRGLLCVSGFGSNYLLGVA